MPRVGMVRDVQLCRLGRALAGVAIVGTTTTAVRTRTLRVEDDTARRVKIIDCRVDRHPKSDEHSGAGEGVQRGEERPQIGDVAVTVRRLAGGRGKKP